jgi:hypothetical protein
MILIFPLADLAHYSSPEVKFSLQSILATSKNHQIFGPTDFSNQWLEIWPIGILHVKLAHKP